MRAPLEEGVVRNVRILPPGACMTKIIGKNTHKINRMDVI